MSDSPGPGNGPPVSSDAFQEWVEHTASARGVEEQELLNQLVSAFWVLDEMNGVTGETDPFGTGPGDAPGTGGTEAGSMTDGDGATDRADSVLGSDPSTSTDRSDAGADDVATPDSVDDDEEPAVGGENGDVAGESGDVAEEVRALRESIHTQLEMVQAVSDLRRQLSDLSLDVENQRSRQEQFTDRISDDLTRLHRRVEELDSEGADTETANAEAVDRLATELREDIESLEATQREFESWIDAEFDEIEGLFEHLLGLTDDLEERLEAVETEMEALREEGTDRDRLADLRRSAQQSGVDRAVCETCEAGVDVAMLDEPRCPDCDAEFADVEPASGWNPFAKSTLRTESKPSAPPGEPK